MKKELQEKLYAKYPKIFRQKDLPMQQTCMCWGIETNDGWYTLLDTLCGHLQMMTDYNQDSKDQNGNLRFPQIEATQVKEKFGTLRFYTNVASDYQDGVISFAEAISGKICDICGAPGSLNTGGWIQSRCEKHKENNYELEESESTKESN